MGLYDEGPIESFFGKAKAKYSLWRKDKEEENAVYRAAYQKARLSKLKEKAVKDAAKDVYFRERLFNGVKKGAKSVMKKGKGKKGGIAPIGSNVPPLMGMFGR